MLNLIKNEHLKIIQRKSNRILFLTFGIVCLLIAFMTKNILSSSGENESVVDYVMFSTNFLFLIQFVSIIIAGSIVSNEFDAGTIKFLLIRPANRSKILFSKYITVLCVGFYLVCIYFLLAVLFGFLLFGLFDMAGDFVKIGLIPIKYLSRFIEIEVIATLTFALSTVFRSSVIATGTSIFLILTGRTFVEVLAHYKIAWGKYILFANTNLTQFLIGNRPLFRDMTLTASLLTLTAYMALFIWASWYSFKKRDVSI